MKFRINKMKGTAAFITAALIALTLGGAGCGTGGGQVVGSAVNG